MKAVYITEFGGPGNIGFRDVPDPPKPSSGEVIVRVHAAGLNRADLLQRRGFYPPPTGYSPNIPGLEFAGEIVETGENVEDVRPGDRVMAITAGEAQAEFVRIDASLLMRVPDGVDLKIAAAIPEAYITAHDAIFTLGELTEGQTLLIHAVGSGVGLAALHMAKQVGAKVIGTSRTREKLDRCREHGLDHGIQAGEEGFAADVRAITDGAGVGVILDLVGASYFTENLESVSTKGRLILVGLTGGSKAGEFDLGAALRKRARIIGTVLRPRSIAEKAEATHRFAGSMLPHVAAGEIVPVVDRAFPAAEAAAAHSYLESNESFGKVLLEF